MPDYFVRRTLCLNGKTYSQVWFDVPHPKQSVEHKTRVKHVHRITDDDKAEFDRLNNSQAVGSTAYSFISFLEAKYPDPDELPAEVVKIIDDGIKEAVEELAKG